MLRAPPVAPEALHQRKVDKDLVLEPMRSDSKSIMNPYECLNCQSKCLPQGLSFKAETVEMYCGFTANVKCYHNILLLMGIQLVFHFLVSMNKTDRHPVDVLQVGHCVSLG